MKVLLTTMGSRGDLQPMLGLALGLRRAGHEVVVAAPPNFKEWVGGLGLPFHPIGFDIYEWSQSETDLARSPARAIRRMSAVLRDEIASQFRDMRQVPADVDCVVTTGLQLAASSWAEKHHVPYNFAAFAPGLMRTANHAPALLPWPNAPAFVREIAWGALYTTYQSMILGGVNRERTTLGLGAHPRFVDLFLGSDVLLAYDPELSESPRSAATSFVETGAWVFPSADALPDEIERFLSSGPPPYYLGFGSVPDPDPARTTRCLVEAIRSVGGRALISRGWANLANEPLPEGFLAAGSLPHEKLFPRLAAVIHHGGAGTTQTAARAGIPQIIVPHGADQFYWASRLLKLGVSPGAVPKTKLTHEQLTVRLRQLAGEPAYRERAAALGERLRHVDGVAATIRYLEARQESRAIKASA